MNEKITVYGTTWCSDCRRAKQLMDSYNIEYNWTDIDEEHEFQNLVKEIATVHGDAGAGDFHETFVICHFPIRKGRVPPPKT